MSWNILFVYVVWQKQFVRREVEISCSQMWISSRNTASSLYKCTSFIHDSTDRDLWITQAVYTFMYIYISTKIIKFCTEKKSTPFNQFKIRSSMLTKLPDCYKSHIRIWKIWTENVNKTSTIIITWYQISKQSSEISDMVYVHMKQYKWSIQGCKTKWY